MSVMSMWPAVIDEFKTLDEVLAGKSISRFGDGELKLCVGGNCISQIADKKLKNEMRMILINPHKNCIVAIPPKTSECPKNWFWDKITHNRQYMALYSPKVKYYSQWITRPDNAPWINKAEFWLKMRSLWEDKDVILVAGSERSLTPAMLKEARSVTHVQATYRDSYAVIDDLEKKVLDLPQKTVLLCAGAAATCLANRLAPHKHALDLGHIGMFREFKEAIV